MSSPYPPITLEIVEARGLVALDSSGTSDPIATASLYDAALNKPLPSETTRTRTVEKDLTPHWGHHATLGLSVPPAELDGLELVFHIYDHDDLGADDDMGLARVPIAELRSLGDGQTLEKWLKLQATPQITKVSGEIKVRACLRSPAVAAQQLSASVPKPFRERAPNVLDVTVVRCNNIKIMDKPVFGGPGSTDPIVTLSVGESTAKTSVKSKSLDPVCC